MTGLTPERREAIKQAWPILPTLDEQIDTVWPVAQAAERERIRDRVEELLDGWLHDEARAFGDEVLALLREPGDVEVPPRPTTDEEYARLPIIDLDAAREPSEAAGACPTCGHEWRRHDPEDGMCDAGMPNAIDYHGDYHGLGPCPCGRDVAYHRRRNAALSREALAR